MAVVQTWSTLNEPTTTTRLMPPLRPSSRHQLAFGALLRPAHRVRIVLVLEQRHEHDRHRQRVQGEGHPDPVPVLAAVGGGEEVFDQEARGQAAEHRAHAVGHHHGQPRSEEHTSELQSLMRISYAVFCLKKKTKSKKQPTQDKKLTKKN